MTPVLVTRDVSPVPQARSARTTFLCAERERELLIRAQGGERAALGELVDSHMKLVTQIAARYERSGLSIQDLASEGVIGLIEAVARFDFAHGARLSTYAGWWIRARIREYALENRRIVPMPSTRAARLTRMQLGSAERRLEQRLGRSPTQAELASEIGVAEADVVSVQSALRRCDVSLSPAPEGRAIELCDADSSSPEREAAYREVRALLRDAVTYALAELPERDRRMVSEQLLDDGRNMADLARELGVTRQRVCQVFSRFRKRLERDLRRMAG